MPGSSPALWWCPPWGPSYLRRTLPLAVVRPGGAMFLVAWGLQAAFQWIAVSNENAQHGQPTTLVEFLPQFLSSTFENWQSEFLQLVWQAAGLALFYSWGSSQSRESDERLEAKIDELLRQQGVDPSRVTEDPVQDLGRGSPARVA